MVTLLLPYNDKINTITSDNGTEFDGQKANVEVVRVDFYFADPYPS